MPVLRVEQEFVQFRFITEQEQTFAVGVEPANRINARRKTELRQRAEIRSVARELRNDTIGLVEGD